MVRAGLKKEPLRRGKKLTDTNVSPRATTAADEDGRYLLVLASGTYTLVVNGTKEMPEVVVEVSVKKRVDVKV